MELAILTGTFIATILIIEGIYYAYRGSRSSAARRVRRRLRTLGAVNREIKDISILRQTSLSEIPWFNRLLSKSVFPGTAQRIVDQAGVQRTLGFYLLLSALLASFGFVGCSLLNVSFLPKVSLTLSCFLLPLAYLYLRKRHRLKKFEKQLPEALDLMARALKAGHAFSAALKMAADEFEEPVGVELERTSDEINFGVSVSEALKNLAARVDCPDLKFFIVSVVIQRETGGNMAEIMENIAYLIRERFKLRGRVRVLSAEGKLSAVILFIVPVTVFLYLSTSQPEYISLLFTDLAGRIMFSGSIIMMLVGALVMRNMVRIRV